MLHRTRPRQASMMLAASPEAPPETVAATRPGRGTLLVLDPQPVDLAEASSELWWRADHTDGELPVCGGWPTVRMLIGSVDGHEWPWTGITLNTPDVYRWVQVLGTAHKMTLEIGDTTNFWRIGHAHQPHGNPVEMPPKCQWWVTWVWANQTFTANEAYTIARRYLSTGLIDSSTCSMETLNETKHRQGSSS